jgi:hypothetical protein
MFGNRKKDILANGIQARAIVTRVEDTDEVNAAARAGGAGALGGLTIGGGATIIDGRNVPGLRDEILKAVADAQSGAAGQAELREVMMKAMGEGNAISALGGSASARAEDPLDRIKKLGELGQAGALTDAEFEAQKAKILGET